jgi:hypothetical protein
MALSIVAQASEPASESLPGITKSSRWSCDIFTGTADALIAAGLITADQLKPQKGRTPGYTAFLSNGEMCPLHLRTWREPGFKAIREQRDGTYSVEVTVAKDVQLWRRRAESAAKHEAEHARINEELAKSGSEYRNWRFRQDFGGCAETWEGTKAQLQAAGIGVGMMFPGEPGVGEYLTCKCPLGFTFRIHLPEYNAAKAAAGIYIAHSSYLPSADEAPFEPCAPGVLQQVWMPSCWGTSDYFTGTADALVRAGIVPSMDLFPGQPGRTKMQASYRADWSPMGAANQNEQRWGATIRKRGKAEFIVEKPVSSAEQQRRRDAHKAYEEDRKQQQAKLAEERKQLRQGVAPQVTIEQFRSDRTRMAEFTIKLLWTEVFAKEDGALSFDIPEDGELWDDLAEAFQTIRDVVREADILRDKKKVAAAQTRLKLVAARNDQGLQSLLRDAKGLRLVHPAPDDEQG